MKKTGIICPQCKQKTDQSPCWNCGYEFPDEELTDRAYEIIKDIKWERDSLLYQKAGKKVPKLIIQIESGCVYGVIADKPVKITILDRDAGGKDGWDAEIDENYVKDNFCDGSSGLKEPIN